MIHDEENDNFDVFLDCLSVTVVARLSEPSKKSEKKRAIKGRKNEIKQIVHDNIAMTGSDEDDALELREFVQYLSEELFLSLPPPLRTLSYGIVQDDPATATKYSTPLDPNLLTTITSTLPPPLLDSLLTYSILPDADANTLIRFLDPVLTTYITTTTSPPPEYTPSITATRPDGCEICAREHVLLTYHHLIPRQMHAKAVKRGWHKDWELNKVAWLCRACHTFVHKIATNEELAREWFDVEALRGREDVGKFARWVGGVRWKAR